MTKKIHPYSYLKLKTAIDECEINSNSQYSDPDDVLPPLKLIKTEDGIVISSDIAISNYMPFSYEVSDNNSDIAFANASYMPELSKTNQCTLAEFLVKELAYQEFVIRDKSSGQEYHALFNYSLSISTDTMRFISPDKGVCIGTIHDINRDFHIIPKDPILTSLDKNLMMDKDLFWKTIDSLNWKEDFNPARCESQLFNTLDVNEYNSFANTFNEESCRLCNRIYNVINKTNDCCSEDRIMDLQSHIMSSGKKAYDLIMKNDAAVVTLWNSHKIKCGISPATIYQTDTYPYAYDNQLYNGSGPVYPSSQELKQQQINAIACLEVINNIDYDNIAPAIARKIDETKESAIYRLQKMIEGNNAEAYHQFDKDEYSKLAKFGSEIGLYATIANIISDRMLKDGYDFNVVKWVNDKPIMSSDDKTAIGYSI